jgi:hypothetical protein
MSDLNYQSKLKPILRSRRPSLSIAQNQLSGSVIWSIAAISALAGLVLAIVWSFEVADSVLGASIANATLGADAKALPLENASPLLGLAFAFAAGLAATFTACNFVVFSCVAPLAAEKEARRRSLWTLLGWMVIGVVSVTALYGVAGAFFGRSIPILSTATLPIGSGDGVPVRLAQASLVFVSLGLCFLIWGLHTLGLIRNPLPFVNAARPWLKPLLIGLMIGGFTVGRPFPLFRKAFEYAADTGNPLLSAGTMAIQGLGNIALMVLALLLLMYGTGGRFERWMQRNPGRLTMLTAISLIVGGTFFVTYWGLRVPSYFGLGWFPHMWYR